MAVCIAMAVCMQTMEVDGGAMAVTVATAAKQTIGGGGAHGGCRGALTRCTLTSTVAGTVTSPQQHNLELVLPLPPLFAFAFARSFSFLLS